MRSRPCPQPKTTLGEESVAVRALQLAGVRASQFVDLHMLGTHAVVAVDVDVEEVAYRSRIGIPALTDRRLLRHLAGLPYLEPIRRADLSDPALRVLREAPEGVLEFTGGHVRRLVRPAIMLRGASTQGSNWRAGLNAASPFAAFCPRMFVLTAEATDVDDAALEASVYGIGLAQAVDDRSVQMRVHPQRRGPTFGPASWRVRETALAAAGLA